mmetsp:Transcript_29152/g.80040  ORF Transcript_29152/g.80040 Transcript_29152/m.80040 type:complete len:233 (+) Transcript_29152:1455-2153(+)
MEFVEQRPVRFAPCRWGRPGATVGGPAGLGVVDLGHVVNVVAGTANRVGRHGHVFGTGGATNGQPGRFLLAERIEGLSTAFETVLLSVHPKVDAGDHASRMDPLFARDVDQVATGGAVFESRCGAIVPRIGGRVWDPGAGHATSCYDLQCVGTVILRRNPTILDRPKRTFQSHCVGTIAKDAVSVITEQPSSGRQCRSSCIHHGTRSRPHDVSSTSRCPVGHPIRCQVFGIL